MPGRRDQERRYHGRGMGVHGGGVSQRSGTLDFGACARAVHLGGRGSIRWRRCGRARSSRLISRRQIPGVRVAAARIVNI
jgi:hypothetical protein